MNLKHAKRMLSLLLTLLLLVNLIPVAFAESGGNDPPAFDPAQAEEQEAGEANVTEAGDAEDPSATTPSSETSEAPSEEEAPPASEDISEPTEPSMTDVTEETTPPAETSEVPPILEEASEPTEPSTTEVAEETAGSVEVEDNPPEEILPNDASDAEATPIAETAETRASGSPIVHGGNPINTNGTLTIRYYNYLEGANKTAYIQAIDLKTIGSAAVYCIEPEESSTGLQYSEAEQAAAWGKLPRNTRRAIGLALAYGYPNQSYSASSNDIYWYGKQAVLNTENYIATQLIVWEILAGVRSSTAPYGLTGSASYRNAFDGGWATIRSTYDAIVAKMAKHNSIPAYAGYAWDVPIYTLQYDRTTGTYRYMLPAERQSDWRECRITLPNGISYLKAADGMTVIGFEATPEAAAALPATGTTCTGISPYLSVDPDTAVMCWQCSNSQTVATMPIGPDPAQAYFTLKAAMHEELEIIKTSDDGNVSGITFTIEEWVQGIGYCRIGTYTTDSQGKITVPNLSVGTKYRVTETVPENYEAEQQSQEITIQTGSNTLTFVNHLAVRDLEIVKTSPDGKVDGIEFYIKNASGTEVGRDTTKDGGKLTFEKLTVGQTYTVVEVVPEGYVCENNNQSITIQAGTNTVSFVNKPICLKIVKQSPDGNVAGIRFNIYAGYANYKNGTVLQTVTTGEDGTIRIDGLARGTYYIEEIVPDGYAEQEVRAVIVNGANTPDNPAVVTFTNVPLAPLEIIKTSPDGKVDGIEFYVTGSSGAEVSRDVTKNGGKLTFEKLVVGQTYTVTEVVPDGYVCENNNQSVTIQAGTNTVRFVNKPLSALKIVKQSEDGNVEGITFQIFTEDGYPNGEIFQTATTDRDGTMQINELNAGIYWVREIVPLGYAPQADKKVTVTENNTRDDPAVVQFDNYLRRGTISVKKVSTSGTALEGATFLLEYSLDGGETWDIIRPETNDDYLVGTCTTVDADGTLTTGKDGWVIFDDLIIYGVTYRLTETVAPAGYQLLAEPVFTGEIDAGDNGSSEIYREVVNVPLLQMPPAGGDGSVRLICAIATVAASASLLGVGLACKRRKSPESNE